MKTQCLNFANLAKKTSIIFLFLLGSFYLQSIYGNSKPIKFPANSTEIVYYIPQFSDFQEISVNEMQFLKQTLADAKQNNIKAVIFELDTPGGRIDVAMKYISILQKSKVPVIAFVNPQAISAGMIIAIASDRIAINSNGTIGDAMPMQMTLSGMKPIVDKPDKIKNDEKVKTATSAGKKELEPAKEKSKTTEKQNDIEKLIKRFTKKLEDIRQGGGKLTPEEKKLAKQKFLTVFFKMLQVLAEKNDRPVRVILAMADPYQKLSLKEDNFEHTKVSPLTLSAVEAEKLGIVDKLCHTKKDVLKAFGLANCKIIVKDKTPTHKFIFFIANPFISGLLILIGIIGLYIEAKTPGFGFAGGLGVTALAIFFVGHIGIGNSNWLPVLIFIIGLILIALEVFVIPGFGLAGISGIVAILSSLLLAFGLDNIGLAINTVGISIILAVIILIFLTIYVLPKSTFLKKITLSAENSVDNGFSSHTTDESLLGCKGEAHGILRPAGIAIINGKRMNVMSDGDFIEKGDKVKVTKVNGMQIIVEKV